MLTEGMFDYDLRVKKMSEAGIDRYFVTCRCADESAPKPDPAMLREILTDLDIAPHEAIMIGDTEFDLAMAAAARTHAGAGTYGAHARARLLRSNPAFVIDHLDDLADQIRQLDRQLSQPL